MEVDRDLFIIRIGSIEKENGIMLSINKVIVHEKYLDATTEGDKLSHDIALIYVDQTISYANILDLSSRAEKIGEIATLTS